MIAQVPFLIFVSKKTCTLTLFRIGFFGAAHGWGDGGQKRPPLPKIYHTYPTIMKLGTVIPYVKKIQKYKNHVRHPQSSADNSIFYLKSANIVLSINTEQI